MNFIKPFIFCVLTLLMSCSQNDNENIVDNYDSVSVNVENAGTLSQALEKYDAKYIKELTIIGEINARDFNFFKNNCISVQYLNLEGSEIKSYEGNVGTNEGYNYYYTANEIPLGACFYWEPIDEGMPSLHKVTIPNNIVAIRRNAFARAYNLGEINFPEGLKTIDFVAFALCKSLKKIALPSTICEIGKEAFRDCKNLKEVKINAVYPPKLANDAFSGISENAELIVPKGSYEDYNKSQWKLYFKIVELTN